MTDWADEIADSLFWWPGATPESIAQALRNADAEATERAANKAKAYADENLQMAGDSILLDPILAGGSFTKENIAKSGDMTIAGTVHSAMYHAAKNIEKAIRNQS